MNTATRIEFSASIEASLAALSVYYGSAKLATLRICCADAFDKHGEAFVDADLQRMLKGAKQLARWDARLARQSQRPSMEAA